MNKSRVLVPLTVVLLVACGGEPAPTQTPPATLVPTKAPIPTLAPTRTPVPTPTPVPIPEMFRTQAQRILEEGSRLAGMTTAGLSYVQMRDQLGTVRGAYDLLNSIWPESVSDSSKLSFQSAIKGWQLALDLWKLKINNSDEPNDYRKSEDGLPINGFDRYMVYMGEDAVTLEHESNYIVREYRGHKYLPFDVNISILLTLAGDYFSNAREKLLSELK